jgi:positive regulator of sigma E activity
MTSTEQSCPECGTLLLANLVRELEGASGRATLKGAYHTECHKCGARLRCRQGHEWEMWGPRLPLAVTLIASIPEPQPRG